MTARQPDSEGEPRDLSGRGDVEVLVRTFYTRAFADPLLGPVFRDVAHMDLEAHLPVMCDFWQTVLFRAGLYRRNALQVHADLHAVFPLSSAHFARWLALWTATVDDCFAGEKAELAKTQASRIAYSISRRLLGESGSEFVTLERPRRRAPDRPREGGVPREATSRPDRPHRPEDAH
jgi:hemoglobin